MNKFLGYIFSPIHYLFFGFFVCLFHPIQWVCYNWGGQETHKKSVDLLNFFLVSTYYLLGSSIRFKNPHKLPEQRPIIFSNHQSFMIFHH
jgi:1-acyl-sn-glycerol-3-phosphate acyltransferase